MDEDALFWLASTNIFKEIGYKVKRPNLIKNIEKNYIKNLKLFA